MARSRNIKPGFFTNEVLALLPYQTQLLFIGLWTLADREGRLEDRPLRIKAALFPYRSADIEQMLNQLQSANFVCRYEVGGNKYIQVTNFLKHQTPHFKEAASTTPAQDKTEALLDSVVVQPKSSRSDSLNSDSLNSDSLNSDSLSETEKDFSPVVFEIAALHPKIAHRKGGRPNRIEQEIIAEKVAQDGRDPVLAGTRNLADAVAQWPKSELKFIPDPVKFYRDENYKFNPAVWDKSTHSGLAGSQGLGVSDDQPDAHTLALREKFAKQHREDIARKKAAVSA